MGPPDCSLSFGIFSPLLAVFCESQVTALPMICSARLVGQPAQEAVATEGWFDHSLFTSKYRRVGAHLIIACSLLQPLQHCTGQVFPPLVARFHLCIGCLYLSPLQPGYEINARFVASVFKPHTLRQLAAPLHQQLLQRSQVQLQCLTHPDHPSSEPPHACCTNPCVVTA